MTSSDICQFIKEKFPYYGNMSACDIKKWEATVRTKLSISNKDFERVEILGLEGRKTGYWKIIEGAKPEPRPSSGSTEASTHSSQEYSYEFEHQQMIRHLQEQIEITHIRRRNNLLIVDQKRAYIMLHLDAAQRSGHVHVVNQMVQEKQNLTQLYKEDIEYLDNVELSLLVQLQSIGGLRQQDEDRLCVLLNVYSDLYNDLQTPKSARPIPHTVTSQSLDNSIPQPSIDSNRANDDHQPPKRFKRDDAIPHTVTSNDDENTINVTD